MAQASFDLNNGSNMLTGTDPEAFVTTFAPFDEVDILGLNCAFGPSELSETMRYICENWPRYTSALPNAGLPIMVEGQKAASPSNPKISRAASCASSMNSGSMCVGGLLRDDARAFAIVMRSMRHW